MADQPGASAAKGYENEELARRTPFVKREAEPTFPTTSAASNPCSKIDCTRFAHVIEKGRCRYCAKTPEQIADAMEHGVRRGAYIGVGEPMTSAAPQTLCRHCERPITKEGYSPPMWWHIHNGSLYCVTTKAETDA